MIPWSDIAGIVFTCVTMNHLGLIDKIEEVTGKELPIINCPKCGSFWFSLLFLLGKSEEIMGEFPIILAVSFLAAYSAIWLELTEGFIDKLYLWLYEKIYDTAADAPSADTERDHTDSTVSKLRQENN